MSQQTITINGVKYDAHTGMKVDVQPEKAATAAPVRPNATSAGSIHLKTQRSTTLNRNFVHANSKPKNAVQPADIRAQAVAPKASSLHRKQIRVQTSEHEIRKFAPQPAPSKRPAVTMSDIAPQSHPMVNRAQAKLQSQKALRSAPAPQHIAATSQQLKQHLVSESLKKAPSHTANTKQIKQKKSSKMPRIMSVLSASTALLLLAGYFTYINMPNLSVRVAAAQAGINASYPAYRPDGYSLNGPIAYDAGQVSIKFASTSSPKNFTVTQTRSNWDSSAVEQNYAKEKWGKNVTTTVDRGLTIYSNGSNAAWVNDGILYTISGDAPLSSQQVLNIATSM